MSDTTYFTSDTIVAKMNEITVNLQPAMQCECACWAEVITTFINTYIDELKK